MKIGMHRTLGVLLAVCALTATPSRADGPPGTIHVVAGAIGGDGQSWATAFGDLQAALDAARSNPATTQIWVAGGVYTPAPVGQRQTPFELVDGVPLFGGFEGDEDSLSDRPPLHEPGSPSTVLSGDLAGDDAGTMNLTENAQRILLADGHAHAVKVDGVVIRGAYWADVGRKGLGLYVNAPGLVLRDVIVEDNRAENVIAGQDEPDLGGGIGVYYTTEPAGAGDAEPNAFAVTVERSVFRRNSYEATENGRHRITGVGMWCDLPRGTTGEISVVDAVFEDSYGQSRGEGNAISEDPGVLGAGLAVSRLGLTNDTPVGPCVVRIEGTRFENNIGRGDYARGGAVAVFAPYGGGDGIGPLRLEISDCDFVGNEAMNRLRTDGRPRDAGAHAGGAVFFRGDWDSQEPDLQQRLTIRDSRFEANRVFAAGLDSIYLGGLGSAVAIRGGGETLIERTTFENNAVTRDSFEGLMAVGYTGGAVASCPIFVDGQLFMTVRDSDFMANRVDIANERGVLHNDGPRVLGAAIAAVNTDFAVERSAFEANGIRFLSDEDVNGFAAQPIVGGGTIGGVRTDGAPSVRITDSVIRGSYIRREVDSGFIRPSQVVGTAVYGLVVELDSTLIENSTDDNQESGYAITPAVQALHLTMTDSRVTGSVGRGVAMDAGSIVRSEIVNNTAVYSNPFDVATFPDDIAREVGGALLITGQAFNSGPITVSDSLIAGNEGPIGGVAVLAVNRDLLITNTTIADNRSTAPFPAGLAIWGQPNDLFSDRTIANTIVWGNSAAGLTGPEVQLAQQFGLPPADQTPQITRLASTTIQDWLGPFDDGVSNADPLFVDASAGDYRLQPGSPALDSGNNTLAAPGSVLDLVHSARFVDDPTAPDTGVGPGPIVDRGAYERGGVGCRADLAAPFGELTFADIARFLQAFANGEPGVDGAQPFGELTFADIAWYLDAFAAGCGS